MCDATFTFGQCGSHFLQCPSKRDFYRLPAKLQTLLTSKHIALVHHVALGFENSFLIAYRDRMGGDRIESQGLPSELYDFVYAKNKTNLYARDIPKLRVTLGPYNSSFFAHDQGAYLWMNLPPALLSAIQIRIKGGAWVDKPRIVALGADANFLLITEKHAAVWDLRNYRTLNSMIEFSRTQERGIAEVHNVVLHPYRYQGFVAHSKNGTLLYENLPQPTTLAVTAMRDSVMRDTKEAARKRAQMEREGSSRPIIADMEIQRRPSLNQHTELRRQWTDRKEQIRKESKGLRLSLSLRISAGGVGFGFGK
ncbi:hypothetical protein BDV96DRAFT_500084 [Lophiotrema nucula]|uniref:Uncharacterized protein n=1 Tax=Lophiotrema nucula TaxID=690887 RepID=A0A6A5YYC1_9PLEO|nr:hypothetical protein BDV96DRAFT_500084 [Lophiotrema nucula]